MQAVGEFLKITPFLGGGNLWKNAFCQIAIEHPTHYALTYNLAKHTRPGNSTHQS